MNDLIRKGYKNTENMFYKRTKPGDSGPLVWPLFFLESMRRAIEYPAQNPDRQTMEPQL